jgi:hypothetical protein
MQADTLTQFAFIIWHPAKELITLPADASDFHFKQIINKYYMAAFLLSSEPCGNSGRT